MIVCTRSSTFLAMLAAATLFSTSSAHAQDINAFKAATAPAGSLWIDTLDLGKMSVGYGKPLAGQSIDRHPLTIKGQVFPHGIGTHALSQIAIDLNGATHFSSAVGVDDETAGKGSVVFEVYGDGKKIADSGAMKGGDAAKVLSVDTTGIKRLILRVDDNEDGIDHDHADWAGAMLTSANAAAPIAVDAPQVVTPIAADPPPPIRTYAIIKAQPEIHGPRVTGATPNRPFLFAIPATGQGPLIYSAKKLPAGLTLDAKTGIISGALQNAGTTVVSLQVKGPRGVGKRNLTIMAGPYMLSRTPPMGWNSWNIYYCAVDEKKVRDATDWIVKSGLKQHGYQYVNIDDCWQGERDAASKMQVNAKFGDMKLLGDYIHARGLKFGIYSSPGPKTCAGYGGSYGHEDQDAQSYVSWGVDYLKHDWCSYGGIATGEGLEKQKKPYRAMHESLAKVNRDIVYSLCQYGMGDVWQWGNDADIKANLWRTTGDIGPSYASMSGIGFNQNGHEIYAGPGHWNDPDMLFVHALAPNEQLTHITLWSMLAAPLLIGSDISKLNQFSIDVLSNDEVIEVDQDPLGRAASRVWKEGPFEVWSRPLWDGTTAVALFNRSRERANVAAKWNDLKLTGTLPVRDLWLQKDLGSMKDTFTTSIAAHGAMMVKIGKPKTSDYDPTKMK